MASNQSFDNVMAQLQAGEDAAAAKIFKRFAERLIDVARNQLDTKVLQKEDPEDVMQSVFKSFFMRNAGGAFQKFDSWDSVWGMLVLITQWKCVRRLRYFHRDRRNVDREVTEAVLLESSDTDVGVADIEPTPSEAAMLTEAVERVMQSLEVHHREILTLSMQGYAVQEISTRVECTERMVYRVLDRVKDLLKRMQKEDG